MAKTVPDDEAKGRRLLTAVERVVASSDSIRAQVKACEARVKTLEAAKNKDTLRELTAKELVRTISNRSAIAGGVSGLPGLLPGVGAIALGVAGGLAELVVLLKFEVELALGLSHLYGFDIDKEEERQLAFLLASVGTYEAAGKSFFADVAKVPQVALWNYGPRRAGRLVVSAMTAVAAIYLWRGLFKAVPFVGIAVGTGVNKVLTARVGERCMNDLRVRRDMMGAAEPKKKARAPKARKPARRKPARAAAPPPEPDALN